MKYIKKVKNLEENGKRRQALFPEIDSVMAEFIKERSSCIETGERTKVTSLNNLVLQQSQ
jgi:hypothetical protein